ncbi:unnamed protein product [Mytilus coruscus]|uniref:C1q domain-containing protein n=1 Tax=Mytilus coruscus TaxID=42192 RepID=A0A6J8CU06_MYTCO|nr:unnamed protein product [Mytilus coruscus]
MYILKISYFFIILKQCESIRFHVCGFEEKLEELQESIKSITADRDDNNDKLNLLFNEIQGLGIKSKSELRKLEHELSFYYKALEKSLDKIEHYNNMISSKNGHLRESLNEAASQAKGYKTQASKDRIYRNLVPRFLLPTNTHNIGFTAVMGTHKEHLTIHQTIIFENVQTNEGLGYNSSSGVFIASVSGLYYFSVVIMSHATEDIETEIVKNGIPIVSTYSGISVRFVFMEEDPISYIPGYFSCGIRKTEFSIVISTLTIAIPCLICILISVLVIYKVHCNEGNLVEADFTKDNSLATGHLHLVQPSRMENEIYRQRSENMPRVRISHFKRSIMVVSYLQVILDMTIFILFMLDHLMVVTHEKLYNARLFLASLTCLLHPSIVLEIC